jgi:ammonia channel protein AmtB
VCIVAAGAVLVIIVAGGAAWVMFAVLARKGLLRVDQVTELAGIDNMDHGEQQQQQLGWRFTWPARCAA